MKFLEDLAARRRFGMQPGLDTIKALCSALGNPERRIRAIHVACTNGKGAVCAILDSCLRAAGLRVGRYTSPHLVKLNERFFLDGIPVSDDKLEKFAAIVENSLSPNRGQSPKIGGQSPFKGGLSPVEPTFFEALTAVAFLLYAEERPDFTILETGLGGRLDATNVCCSELCVITRIGLDHCDWLGDTVEKIAAEKAGIVKAGVPVVLGRNVPEVVDVVRARAEEVGAPFHYAPDLADGSEIPADFSLVGSFNRENAVTALAALKTLFSGTVPSQAGTVPRFLGTVPGFSRVVWPGRFQRVGRFIIDGAHNPPAARALSEALGTVPDRMGTAFGQKGTVPGQTGTVPSGKYVLVAGVCGDKDVEETLRILKPHVARAIAVRTNNPRSLGPEELAARMESVGIPAVACGTLKDALELLERPDGGGQSQEPVLVCGSLFLAGEALVELGAYPWGEARFDPSERLRGGVARGGVDLV